MSQKIELLAPGGSVNAIKAAIIAGANAVYCGLDTFNARNRAANISFDQLNGVLRLAHQYDCEVFLTLNIVILEHEIPALFNLLNKLVNTTIDAIIVQDLGIFVLVNHYFPTLNIHASTQLTTHNEGQIHFLSNLGATRVNLSRELNLAEIKQLTTVAHKENVLSEVFVHGALCIAFSGQCYSSSVSVGNSGNRGRCSQACRDEYEITNAGNKFPLNLKDNSAYFDLPQLVAAGVDSLKIEGRIKGENYVHTVVDSWRQQIDQFVETGKLIDDNSNLYKVFNRDFTNSFLQGDLTKTMFIDNPRDHSFDHANEQNKAISVVQIHDTQQTLAAEKNDIMHLVKEKISVLNIDKILLTLTFSGAENEPLVITVNTREQTKEQTQQVSSTMNLIASEKSALDKKTLEKRFKSFNNANYQLTAMYFEQLFATDSEQGLSIPFKELSAMKKRVALLLNNNKAPIAPVAVPKLIKHNKLSTQPSLSILISDEKEANLQDLTTADIYFKLPESFKKNNSKYIDILLRNPRFIPWFPAVLIGKDYLEAVKILEQVKPQRIVTNNTGIAYMAGQLNIDWLAGPFLNTTNSYALLTLKAQKNCLGAFISNEINRNQIRNIARPENFKLVYSIYHPILMMTSRQCFFQRTVGCSKPSIEDGCMLKCEKATTITNVKGVSFAVDKQKGGYPSIYNHEQFLNTDAIDDFSNLFDEFFIDLTDIGSGSKTKQDKALLIKLFDEYLVNEISSKVSGKANAKTNVKTNAKVQLNQMISIATNAQYQQGL
ncbi:MAG: collagenase-like protease [Gammaproteobacteria bacterium]|nr:MAG: collagenase-like protease [Gammaproteobacteria bacterium]